MSDTGGVIARLHVDENNDLQITFYVNPRQLNANRKHPMIAN